MDPGPFDESGAGSYSSWNGFLTSITDCERYDWETATKYASRARVNRLLIRLNELAAHCPESCQLVHGDFGSNNVLTDGRHITGVIDWSEALIGDPLYDVANIFFWRTWLACMEQQARYFEPRLSGNPRVEERLLCYQLRIGLNEIYLNAINGKAELIAWAISRCDELVG